jgi:hypothetical protein
MPILAPPQPQYPAAAAAAAAAAAVSTSIERKYIESKYERNYICSGSGGARTADMHTHSSDTRRIDISYAQ